MRRDRFGFLQLSFGAFWQMGRRAILPAFCGPICACGTRRDHGRQRGRATSKFPSSGIPAEESPRAAERL